MLAPAVAMLLLAADDSLLTTEKFIAEGQWLSALESLKDAPPTAKSRLLASKAWDGLGDPKRAVEHAEAALALEPRSEAAHLQLGQIFLGHNTPQAALEIFTDALAIHPDSLLLRLGQGIALKELTRYDEAAVELSTCLRRQPDFPLAFDALATVYLHARRFEDAIGLAEQYRRHRPDDFRGAYFLAAARDGIGGTPAETESLVRASIAQNAGFAAAHSLLGKLLLQGGRPVEAIVPLEQALRLRPDYAPAALHLAQAYQRSGRDADAARAFARVRELKAKESQPAPSLRYHRGGTQ